MFEVITTKSMLAKFQKNIASIQCILQPKIIDFSCPTGFGVSVPEITC